MFCCTLAQSELDSFLIEISALILAKKDEDGSFLVNKILDKTGMKGTGARAHACYCAARPSPVRVFTAAYFTLALQLRGAGAKQLNCVSRVW